MIQYKFYLDNDGVLCCLKCDSNNEKNISENEAMELLKKFDRESFTHVDITTRNMNFTVGHWTVKFINYREIIEELGDYLPKTLPKIERMLYSNQKKKHSDKNIHNLKLAGIGLTVGSLAMCSLLTNYNARKYSYVNSGNSVHEWNLDASENSDAIKSSDDNVISDEVIDNSVDTNQDIDDKCITFFDYSNERYSETGEYAYNLYYQTVFPYANSFGVSPELVMAILTQESAGKDSNLMQIEFSAWEDQVLSVYDFETNQTEKYVLTNDSEKYNEECITCISENDLNVPSTNISVGCILLTQSMKSMNYHIGAGIQCYNFGIGNMRKVLEKTSDELGISVDEILSSQKNLDFTNYTYIIKVGDPDYLQHVLRYVDNLDDGIKIKYVDDSGNVCENNITILPSKTK